MKAEKLLGLREMPKHKHNEDQWYDWLINEHLPTLGEESMTDFIKCKFDPSRWILWELYTKGHLDHNGVEFLGKLKEGFKELGLEFKEPTK